MSIEDPDLGGKPGGPERVAQYIDRVPGTRRGLWRETFRSVTQHQPHLVELRLSFAPRSMQGQFHSVDAWPQHPCSGGQQAARCRPGTQPAGSAAEDVRRGRDIHPESRPPTLVGGGRTAILWLTERCSSVIDRQPTDGTGARNEFDVRAAFTQPAANLERALSESRSR